MKKVLATLLLGLAAISPALANSINPLDGKGLPIPGDLGMEYFYGEWMPWQSPDALVFNSATFHRDGYVTYDWKSPEAHTKNPPEQFKAVAWDKKTVLLAAKFWNKIINKLDYRFWSLTLRNPENTKIPALYWGSCLDRQFGKTEWQMSADKIFTFFKKSRSCNPLLSGSSKKYPWEVWSPGYFSLVSR